MLNCAAGSEIPHFIPQTNPTPPDLSLIHISSEPISGSAYDLAIALPRTLAESLRLLRESKPLVDLFGDRFVLAYTAVKEAEYETFAQVISSWEREHLLLNV